MGLFTRFAYALTIAAVGVTCGVLGATSLVRANHTSANHTSANGSASEPPRTAPRASYDERITASNIVRNKAVARPPTRSRSR